MEMVFQKMFPRQPEFFFWEALLFSIGTDDVCLSVKRPNEQAGSCVRPVERGRKSLNLRGEALSRLADGRGQFDGFEVEFFQGGQVVQILQAEQAQKLARRAI